MTIMEEVKCENYKAAQYQESWVMADRYEYCDAFYEKKAEKKASLLQRIATVLTTVLA